MKLKLLFALLIVTISNAQTQIGNSIYGEAAKESSGASVVLSGDGKILAIGAPGNFNSNGVSGHVRVYKNTGGNWIQLGQDIDGLGIGDAVGQYKSIALSDDGSTIAVASSGNSDNGLFAGHVRMFKNISGNWVQVGDAIVGKATHEFFGSTVSISGDGSIVAITGGNQAYVPGYVSVYENINGIWTLLGNEIHGFNTGDYFGSSISISANGNTLGIGAEGYDSYTGQVRIYENTAGIWTQIGNSIDGESIDDWSGNSISLSSDGKIVAIGARYNDGNGTDSGHVRVYENISGVWTQIGSDIDGEDPGDWSGGDVSLSADGNVLAIGAEANKRKGNVGLNYGHIRIYQNISGKWIQLGIDIDGDTSDDYFGLSVSLSKDGKTVAGGAPNNNNTTGFDHFIGQVKVYSLIGILSSDTFVLENFNIYPNPTTEILNIELDNNLILEKVLIYNTSGQLVKETSEKTINVSAFAKGMYNVQVVTNQGKATKKVIVK